MVSRLNAVVAAGLAFALTACTITSPTTDGVSAYLRSAWPTAEAEFAPLAQQGDTTAQFYMVVMSIRGLLDAPLDEETQRSYLVSSASGGELRALGLMVWLSADTDQRREWLDAYRTSWAEVHSLNRGDNLGQQLRMLSAMDSELVEPMEELIGGPLSSGAFSNLFLSITQETEDDFLRASLALSDADFLTVDQALARDKNKYAQARLALRHREGRGVDQNDRKAIRLLRAAGSTTPGTHNCLYQPEVGNTPASLQCFGQGPSIPAVARAQLELCQMYAFGQGTEQDQGKAEFWCNRAMRDARYRTRARDVLIEMDALEPAE
ncbi:MAG: hypothetical protein AAGI89_05120 [Pseudomonadota bacterium]